MCDGSLPYFHSHCKEEAIFSKAHIHKKVSPLPQMHSKGCTILPLGNDISPGTNDLCICADIGKFVAVDLN